MNGPTRPQGKPAQNPLGLVGGVAGAAVGFYCGAQLLIPGVAIVLLLVLFNKTTFKPRWFKFSTGVIVGHMVWMAAGAFLVGINAVLLDLVLLGLGVTWLLIRPSIAAVVYLIVVEAVSVAMNVSVIVNVPAGSLPHKALVVHIALRLLAIGCLIGEYRRFVQRDRDSATPAAVDPLPAPND